jgi:hypothetical protein
MVGGFTPQYLEQQTPGAPTCKRDVGTLGGSGGVCMRYDIQHSIAVGQHWWFNSAASCAGSSSQRLKPPSAVTRLRWCGRTARRERTNAETPPFASAPHGVAVSDQDHAV